MATEEEPPYPPAPPSLGLSCSSAGESKHEKQPIATGQENHNRVAVSIKGATFLPAPRLLCSSAVWGALIEPGGGWDRIFPARGSREGGRWGESEAKEGSGRKGAFFIGFLEGKRRGRKRAKQQGASLWPVEEYEWVVDSAGSLPSRVYRGAAGADAQLIRGFARVHTAPFLLRATRLVIILR